MIATVKPASSKQAHLILSLQGMAKNDENRAEAALAIEESMTVKEASAKIKELMANQPMKSAPAPAIDPALAAFAKTVEAATGVKTGLVNAPAVKTAEKPAETVPCGFYMLEGSIYQVVSNKAGTNR